MIGYIIGGAVALIAVATAYEYHKRHEIKPGNLSYGTGMAGLDAGIPPEVGAMVVSVVQIENRPEKLRELAGAMKASGYVLAADVLNKKADYIASHSA